MKVKKSCIIYYIPQYFLYFNLYFSSYAEIADIFYNNKNNIFQNLIFKIQKFGYLHSKSFCQLKKSQVFRFCYTCLNPAYCRRFKRISVTQRTESQFPLFS